MTGLLHVELRQKNEQLREKTTAAAAAVTGVANQNTYAILYSPWLKKTASLKNGKSHNLCRTLGAQWMRCEIVEFS